MDGLRKKRLFLLDMDGTIYIDQTLFSGTLPLLNYIRRIGGRYLFLTNNSSKSVPAFMEKMRSLGIETVYEDYLTSAQVTKTVLEGKYQKIYVLGTASFKQELRHLPITDRLEDDIDCLVIGFDTELTFQKLEDACILLNRGVDYIATNPDYVCPTWYGYVPDCGSVADMLFNATGRRPRFIGKPQPDMVRCAMEKTGFSPEETVMIGDRLYTDIACGVNAGVDAVLVLSGEATLQQAQEGEIHPSYILEDVGQLLACLTQTGDGND